MMSEKDRQMAEKKASMEGLTIEMVRDRLFEKEADRLARLELFKDRIMQEREEKDENNRECSFVPDIGFT